MEKRSELVFALILLSLSVLFFTYTAENKNLQEEEIYFQYNITGTKGIDLNKSALTFGNVMPMTASVRFVNVENAYSSDIRLHISTKGDDEFLYYEDKMIVGRGETKVIEFVVNIPENITEEQYGEREGKVKITINLVD